MMILDSFTVGLSSNLTTTLATQFREFIGNCKKHVGAKRNTLRTVPFSFPAKIQNGLSKTTILVSLTVGFSFNLDMLFTIQLCTHSPLGFAK